MPDASVELGIEKQLYQTLRLRFSGKAGPDSKYIRIIVRPGQLHGFIVRTYSRAYARDLVSGD